MPKSATLANDSLLIGLDEHAQVYDVYYPHVGLENHTAGKLLHKIGVFCEGVMSWLDDDGWDISIVPEADSLVSTMLAVNASLQVSLRFEDCVYNEKNIFIRSITLHNDSPTKRTLKVYFNQQFEIYEAHRGDTALYDPTSKSIIHYKGRRVFLINCEHDVLGVEDYSVGLLGIEGREGTYVDAHDGKLEKNPIEHGFVDSVIGCTCEVKGGADYAIRYWMCVGKTLDEVRELNVYVFEKTPTYLVQTTRDYWKAWVNKEQFSCPELGEDAERLYKQSLLIIRAHVDQTGAIIASSDSDLLKQGRDYYNYMWPRDAALTSCALQEAGYWHVTRKFFRWCAELITREGYFMHKYRPDGSFGASWHPWVQQSPDDLPIQEDETALFIIALKKYYNLSRDIELIESLYNPCIKKAADFMCEYVDTETGLPLPSYDLWEEKYNISTFTASTVYAALNAASECAGLLGKSQSQLKYKTFAEKIKKSLLDKLYDKEDGFFYKGLYRSGKTFRVDRTCDMSSIYGIIMCGVLDVADERVAQAMRYSEEVLRCFRPDESENQGVGGFARYDQDAYFRASHDFPGNPWIITTLWVAQHRILKATSVHELEEARQYIDWVIHHARKSGILPEQIHPLNNTHISASPLTWSHAEYVQTVSMYTKKRNELQRQNV